jgi:hypothetical protein
MKLSSLDTILTRFYKLDVYVIPCFVIFAFDKLTNFPYQMRATVSFCLAEPTRDCLSLALN